MSPEEQIRMLIEENARLRAQLQQGSEYFQATPNERYSPFMSNAEVAEDYDAMMNPKSPGKNWVNVPYKERNIKKPGGIKKPGKPYSDPGNQHIRKL
jgi:hypothetical protein